MAFLILGVLLLAMKMGGYGPVADWSWIWVLAPFGAAVLWWTFADSSGLTKRREMEKMEQRKVERRKRDMAALGLDVSTHSRAERARDAARREQGQPAGGGERSMGKGGPR